ncbi:MAG: 50S ribosomal protein L10 [Clostridiales Family XIII bacterium]|jgi:large subunit ribosomal protein L10|nr:50S ribosomal protein L10 [Clostridiales Family XIII bacterium]
MSEESKIRKQQVIDEIADKLERSNSLVVVDYIGITVAEADALRNKLRDAEVDYKVYKNTLAKRAIAGTGNEKLAEILDGPSAFAFGYDDSTAPARAIDSFIREVKKMQFKAGIIDGVYYDAEGIAEIAKIPSRDDLIAKFMGSIQSPLSKLVRTFAAIAEADGGDAAASDAGEASGEAPAEEKAVKAEDAETAAETPVEEAPVPTEAPAEEKTAQMEDADVAAEAAPESEAAPVEEATETAAETPAEKVPEAEESSPAEASTEASEETATEDTPAGQPE